MSEQAPDPELASFEQALKSLTPVLGRIDRDALMFEAGRTSVRQGSWLWPAATVVAACVAVALGILWQQRPAVVVVDRTVPQVIERIVYVPSPEREPEPFTAAESPATGPLVRTDYLRLRNEVLRWGVDALPPLPAADALAPSEPIERPRFFDSKDTKATGDRL